MIRAIIFDYGNVIARLDNTLFLKRIVQHSPRSISEIEKVIYHQPNLSHQYESGRITSGEFYTHVVESCCISMSKIDFRRAFTDIFTTILTTIQLIKELKPHYKLAVLSNTNEWDFEDELMNIEVLPLFDAVTASFQVGSMKPDERIYHDVLKKLSLPPEVCVYIDDIEEYVEAARRLGIQGAHYTSHQELLYSLYALGVRI